MWAEWMWVEWMILIWMSQEKDWRPCYFDDDEVIKWSMMNWDRSWECLRVLQSLSVARDPVSLQSAVHLQDVTCRGTVVDYIVQFTSPPKEESKQVQDAGSSKVKHNPHTHIYHSSEKSSIWLIILTQQTSNGSSQSRVRWSENLPINCETPCRSMLQLTSHILKVGLKYLALLLITTQSTD